jgi:hypothetical protein
MLCTVENNLESSIVDRIHEFRMVISEDILYDAQLFVSQSQLPKGATMQSKQEAKAPPED